MVSFQPDPNIHVLTSFKPNAAPSHFLVMASPRFPTNHLTSSRGHPALLTHPALFIFSYDCTPPLHLFSPLIL